MQEVQQLHRQTHNYCFKNALNYVAGYIAQRVEPEKYAVDPKQFPYSWTAHLSKGGLAAPSKELYKMCHILESEFKKFHGETISFGEDPQGNFIAQMKDKYPTWPPEIIIKFNNIRFNAQIRYLNEKIRNKKKGRTARCLKQTAQHMN